MLLRYCIAFNVFNNNVEWTCFFHFATLPKFEIAKLLLNSGIFNHSKFVYTHA